MSARTKSQSLVGGRLIAGPAFALVIVSFLLSTTVSLLSLHAMSQRNTREMNKALATQIYDYITGEISGPITTARTMASTSFLIDALKREGEYPPEEFERMMAEYLSSIESGLGYRASFVISDATKRYYTRDGFNRVVDPAGNEEDAWYTEFASTRKRYDLDVDSDEQNKNDLVVYVNARVERTNGSLLGICGLGVHMTGIQDLFRTFENTYGIKVNLVDATGTVQVDTDTTNIEAARLDSLAKGGKRGEYVYTELSGNGFAVTKYVEDLGWYLIIRSDGTNTMRQFANVILLNLVLCVVVIAVLFIALRINHRRTRELTNASLIDHATELLNRRAYEQDRVDLIARSTDSDLVCATFDVNGLKTVNDTLGHDAGDELIRGAADCLSTCFGGHGTLYRTGGDEFAAFLHVSARELERLRKKLDELVSAWSGTKVESLAISCGFAAAREFPDKGIPDLCKISDERMYEDKERYYASRGIERRRT